MSKHDDTIGTNVRRLREARGLSQAAVATSMQALGWKWTQPIVAAIEKGDRSLKLAEAVALCSMAVLDVDEPSDLLGAPLVDLWWAAGAGVHKEADALRVALQRFWHAQIELARITDELVASGGEVPDTDTEAFWLMQADWADVLDNVQFSAPWFVDPGPYQTALLEGPLREKVRKLSGPAANSAE